MLPRQERISGGSEIKELLHNNPTIVGKPIKADTPLLSCFAKVNHLPVSRLTVICKKRLGKAVRRNRLRRQISAAFLKNRHKIAQKMDIIVIPRKITAPFPVIEREFVEMLAVVGR